jgi:hypothetical protein
MPKFKKKPVEIEAVRWTGDNVEEMEAHVREPVNEGIPIDVGTLEGIMRCDIGDWMIRGVKGELYPCKDDIFKMSYEQIDW